jgi:hypothetical protein
VQPKNKALNPHTNKQSNTSQKGQSKQQKAFSGALALRNCNVFHSKNILVFDNAIKQHVYVFCPRNYLLRMHSIKGRGVPGRQCG